MMLTGETIYSYTYDEVLKELRKRFKLVWLDKNPAEMLLQHGKATHKFEDSESHQNLGGQCYPIHPTAPIWYLQITTYFKSSRMLCAV
jgi:hypothetical protein